MINMSNKMSNMAVTEETGVNGGNKQNRVKGYSASRGNRGQDSQRKEDNSNASLHHNLPAATEGVTNQSTVALTGSDNPSASSTRPSSTSSMASGKKQETASTGVQVSDVTGVPVVAAPPSSVGGHYQSSNGYFNPNSRNTGHQYQGRNQHQYRSQGSSRGNYYARGNRPASSLFSFQARDQFRPSFPVMRPLALFPDQAVTQAGYSYPFQTYVYWNGSLLPVNPYISASSSFSQSNFPSFYQGSTIGQASHPGTVTVYLDCNCHYCLTSKNHMRSTIPGFNESMLPRLPLEFQSDQQNYYSLGQQTEYVPCQGSASLSAESPSMTAVNALTQGVRSMSVSQQQPLPPPTPSRATGQKQTQGVHPIPAASPLNVKNEERNLMSVSRSGQRTVDMSSQQQAVQVSTASVCQPPFLVTPNFTPYPGQFIDYMNNPTVIGGPSVLTVTPMQSHQQNNTSSSVTGGQQMLSHQQQAFSTANGSRFLLNPTAMNANPSFGHQHQHLTQLQAPNNSSCSMALPSMTGQPQQMLSDQQQPQPHHGNTNFYGKFQGQQ